LDQTILSEGRAGDKYLNDRQPRTESQRFQVHFDKEGTHHESKKRIAYNSNPLRTVIGLCNVGYARKHDIRCVSPNGQEPAGVVRAIRLQLHP